MKKIAYVRVSTPDQRHDRQIEGLSAFCDELHVETLSACAARRPVYDHVLSMLEPGDMLVVWDLDRAFRSVVDALTEAEKLRARGIHFRIANLHIDTSTPAGIFVYTMLSALAEFERRPACVRDGGAGMMRNTDRTSSASGRHGLPGTTSHHVGESPVTAEHASDDTSVVEGLEKYLAHLAHLDMPLAVKIDLIAALHAIMQNFVDRAFGDDPVQQVAEGGAVVDDKDAKSPMAVLSSENTESLENPNALSSGFRRSVGLRGKKAIEPQ